MDNNERRCPNQSPCGRRFNPNECDLKHQQWEQLCIEREKRFEQKIDSVIKTAEAKAEADAQAIVVKARADLVTERRMKEYVDSNIIKRGEILAFVGVMGILITLILKLIGH